MTTRTSLLASAGWMMLVTGTAAAQAPAGAPPGAATTTPSAAPQATSPAVAPTAAPATAAAPAVQATEGEEVLVVAERGSNQAIDRKSYAVRQGPAAEIATGVDVMRDLPSVSVDAAGRIELLGNASVRILIDGRPVPDALSILRSMSAAQIARIEVITNPSAQFPAEGTAGIINVITRRSSRDGLGGTVTAGGDTRGGGVLRVAPTWTKDKWSLSTSPTIFAQNSPSSIDIERQQLAGPPDGITNRTEESRGEQRVRGFGSRSQVVYRPDAKRSVSFALNSSSVASDGKYRNLVTARAGEFPTFEQLGDNENRFRAGNASLDYRAEGDKQGELFTVAASGTLFSFDSDAQYRETPVAGGATRTLDIASSAKDRQATFKVDYATPLTKTSRMSVGGALDWRDREFTDRAVGGGLLGPARNQRTDFAGDYVEGAAYATYQTMLGAWKVLPGVRAQARRYSLDDLNGDGPSRIDLFPSMFVERKLGKRWTAVGSYSRRIAWADIADLSPVLRLRAATFGVQGNPNLDPETTDAFELRAGYAGKVHSFDLTLYDRITHDTFDRVTLLNPDGVLVSSPVNAGRRVDQGLEAAFRGKLGAPLRYSLTGNVTAVTRNVGALGNRRRDAQYRGKLQLDYTQGKVGDPGFDQITANLRYEGPVRQFQYKRSDFVDADITWTHRFTPRLAVVTTATSLFGGTRIDSVTRTPFLLERRRENPAGRTLRLTLTYQLSATPTPQSLQAPQAPSIPPVPTL